MDEKTQQQSGATLKQAVKARYGDAALRAQSGANACCGSGKKPDPISSNLYEALQEKDLPDSAVLASLGCGNPTALANLQLGEVVLDLGSGGGIDALLSAQRVGPSGKIYGLDMTDQMLGLARENQLKARISNVEFIRGEIENIPLPDNSVDVIISNCVVNLSGDKDAVFRESFRVLRPGGRLAIADVVTLGDVPEQVRTIMGLWLGCIAGALNTAVFEAALKSAGFQDISITPERVYEYSDVKTILEVHDIDSEELATQMHGKFASAFVRATKPS